MTHLLNFSYGKLDLEGMHNQCREYSKSQKGRERDQRERERWWSYLGRMALWSWYIYIAAVSSQVFTGLWEERFNICSYHWFAGVIRRLEVLRHIRKKTSDSSETIIKFHCWTRRLARMSYLGYSERSMSFKTSIGFSSSHRCFNNWHQIYI